MPERKATCNTCPYFQQYEDPDRGECRKRAPTDAWAAVRVIDWCGEHPQFDPSVVVAPAAQVVVPIAG